MMQSALTNTYLIIIIIIIIIIIKTARSDERALAPACGRVTCRRNMCADVCTHVTTARDAATSRREGPFITARSFHFYYNT